MEMQDKKSLKKDCDHLQQLGGSILTMGGKKWEEKALF